MNGACEKKLLDFLLDIDDRLATEGMEGAVPLFVFGGAAVVIAYGSKRATMDIDAYVEDRRIEKKLLDWAGHGSELEEKHGLYLQIANTALMLLESPDWMERSVEVLKGRFKRLRPLALCKEDLILSKLSRYNDRDRDDIEFIAKTRKVDPKRLIALYKSARDYYVGHLGRLDSTFNVVLQEHFAHKPTTFHGLS